MSEPEHFVQPAQGRFAVGCAALFIGPMALGTAFQVQRSLGMGAIAIPLGIGAVMLAIAYYFFSIEVRATLDERGLRLARTRVLFGARLGERIEWEIPRAALTSAKEIRTKQPTRNGGWQHSVELRLPEQRVLDARVLGGGEDSRSAYSRLARALKKALGAGFTSEERLR